MKKRRKQPTFNDTWFIHQSPIGTSNCKDKPKSESYRYELEHLISKPVKLTGTFVEIRKRVVNNTHVNQILLTDVYVHTKTNEIFVDHIWTTVTRGYMARNKINQRDVIECDGYFYEYLSHDTRNIGFRLTEAHSLINTN